MNNRVQIPQSTQQLKGELAALKLKIALQECREDELNRLLSQYDRDELLDKRLAQGESAQLRRIDRALRRIERRKMMRKTLPKVGRVAAALLLCFYLSLSVAMAASPNVRVELMNFFMNIEPRYTSFGFEDTGTFVDVPAEWTGYYYPTYIPEGFEITDVLPNMGISWKHADGSLLDFDEMGPGGSGNLDTENAKNEFISINGHTALISEKNGWTAILWNVDNRSLLIDFTGDREEAIKIAESVRMIKD